MIFFVLSYFRAFRGEEKDSEGFLRVLCELCVQTSHDSLIFLIVTENASRPHEAS